MTLECPRPLSSGPMRLSGRESDPFVHHALRSASRGHGDKRADAEARLNADFDCAAGSYDWELAETFVRSRRISVAIATIPTIGPAARANSAVDQEKWRTRTGTSHSVTVVVR